MPQIYEILCYIDSQFNTFDSQNAFCESNSFNFMTKMPLIWELHYRKCHYSDCLEALFALNSDTFQMVWPTWDIASTNDMTQKCPIVSLDWETPKHLTLPTLLTPKDRAGRCRKCKKCGIKMAYTTIAHTCAREGYSPSSSCAEGFHQQTPLLLEGGEGSCNGKLFPYRGVELWWACFREIKASFLKIRAW